MLTERLRARCPSAHPIGTGIAMGFRLNFSKRGEDGSGKAMLTKQSGQNAFGVMFTISAADAAALDEAEGPGYLRDDFFEITQFPRGHRLTVAAFLARPEAINEALAPYDWYLELVVAGALQHDLPREHIDGLKGFRSSPDPDLGRPQRLAALKILRMG